MTTLLYYLIDSVLPCLADAKIIGDELGNKEGFFDEIDHPSLLLNLSLLSLRTLAEKDNMLASTKKGSKESIR